MFLFARRVFRLTGSKRKEKHLVTGVQILDRKKARDYWRKGDMKVVGRGCSFPSNQVLETTVETPRYDGTFAECSE